MILVKKLSIQIYVHKTKVKNNETYNTATYSKLII